MAFSDLDIVDRLELISQKAQALANALDSVATDSLRVKAVIFAPIRLVIGEEVVITDSKTSSL